eukprot:GEZU01009089.1.p1 GENE.GEZU01009089.1~~GEZU01009089.1.p1  ORF type:complete len:173 (-),score=33.34 GEZU01009089.1:163-681(-)
MNQQQQYPESSSSSNNAFATETKRYKLYKSNPAGTDFSQVIDFSNLDNNTPENREIIEEVSIDELLKANNSNNNNELNGDLDNYNNTRTQPLETETHVPNVRDLKVFKLKGVDGERVSAPHLSISIRSILNSVGFFFDTNSKASTSLRTHSPRSSKSTGYANAYAITLGDPM